RHFVIRPYDIHIEQKAHDNRLALSHDEHVPAYGPCNATSALYSIREINFRL
ncbi:unnamed protein product, partial [Ceratitis capitata]